MKSYTLNGMRYLFQVLLALGIASSASAQSGAVHVTRDNVDAALAKGGVLVAAPQVQVAGVRRDTPGALGTQKGTTILYVTAGEGMFAAGARSQRLTKGDVLVVPAGTAQSFAQIASPISFLQIVVPVLATDAKSELVHVDRDKVAAATKKAAPLADGPNLRVSGGYRPANSRQASPTSEIHAHEADLFVVIEGDATQMLGGMVVDGKDTGPGQIRGSRTEGGATYQLRNGDVMWVPANMPHWFPEIRDPLSYLLVKVFY